MLKFFSKKEDKVLSEIKDKVNLKQYSTNKVFLSEIGTKLLKNNLGSDSGKNDCTICNIINKLKVRKQ